VIRDKKTGCGKGFGFFLFKEKSGVVFALKQAKSIEIDGRKLRIFKSTKNPQKQIKKKKFQKKKAIKEPNKQETQSRYAKEEYNSQETTQKGYKHD